jgi:hypothetical protein
MLPSAWVSGRALCERVAACHCGGDDMVPARIRIAMAITRCSWGMPTTSVLKDLARCAALCGTVGLCTNNRAMRHEVLAWTI